jgi:hypothetical protein
MKKKQDDWEVNTTNQGDHKDRVDHGDCPQEPRQGEHCQVDADGDEKMGEINMIFRGSMYIASKTQGKKLEQEISLTQRIKLGRKMKWSDVDISFRPKDHPGTELSERKLPFVVKLPIKRHKVAKH